MKYFTKQSRFMLLFSAGLALLVIFTALMVYNTAGKYERTSFAVLIFIFFLAAGSVIFVYFSKARKNRILKKLGSGFLESYDILVEKINAEPLSMIEKKEIARDLLEIFFEAQDKGRNPDDVVGKDLDSFARHITEAYGYRNRFLWNILTSVQITVFYIFLVHFFQTLEIGRFSAFFSVKVSPWLFLFLAANAFVLIPLIKTALKKQKNWLMLMEIIVFCVLFIGFSELMHGLYPDARWVRDMSSDSLSLIPNFLAFSIYLLLIPLSFLGKQAIKNLSLKKI